MRATFATPGAAEQRAAPAGTATPPTVRFGLRRFLLELAGAVIVAVLTGAAVLAATAALPAGPASHAPSMVANIAAGVVLALLVVVLAYGLLRRVRPWLKLVGCWTLLAGFGAAIPALLLGGTRYYFGGSSVDNTFRLQYLERLASSPGLADGNYADMPPYYPAGWFWLGARFADLAGLHGWAAYKPYAILWTGLTGAVAFVLWSLVLRRRQALVAGVVTVLAGFSSLGVEEPYAWPSAAWLAPIAVLAWRAVRDRTAAPVWVPVLIGAYLGFAGVTYTLHLAFGAFVVLALAVLAVVLDVRAGTRPRAALRQVLPRLAIVVVVSLAPTLVVWLPFLLAGGFGLPSHAARYLPADSAFFPMPFGPGSVLGVVCLAGVGWLVLRARRDAVAAALLALTVLVYVWFALSGLAIVLDTTLLAFRLTVVLDTVLLVAGALGLAELAGRLRRAMPGWRQAITACTALLATIGVVTLSQQNVGTVLRPLVQQAEQDYLPTGTNALGQSDGAEDGAWTDELIGTIARLSGRPPEGNVVLAAHESLLSFRPYWGFQHITPHYANPLAHYGQRNDLIEAIGTARSHAQYRSIVDGSRFGEPNVYVLRKAESGELTYNAKFDSFPNEKAVGYEVVTVDPAVFDAPGYVRRDVGPFAVIVRR